MISPRLPNPDAATLDRIAAMQHHLQQRIVEAGGWLSLDQCINELLYAPGLGYYVRGTPIFSGAEPDAGDFITAPEQTPLFAYTWARALAPRLAECPYLLELGGGSGRFAADVLKALAALKRLPDRYAMLERSAELRVRQRATLEAMVPEHLDRVVWLNKLPNVLGGVVFMNEVLDAMAPRVLVRREGQWHERGVIAVGHQLRLDDRVCNDQAACAVADARAPETGDCVVEWNFAAEALMETLARACTASKLPVSLLVCDYGFERAGRLPERYAQGTLRACYRHRLVEDILTLPGEMDITAHVDFLAMLEAAQRGGLKLVSFQTQQQWLVQNGILRELLSCGEPDSKPYLAAARAVHTLISADAMGEVFKVLEAGK